MEPFAIKKNDSLVRIAQIRRTRSVKQHPVCSTTFVASFAALSTLDDRPRVLGGPLVLLSDYFCHYSEFRLQPEVFVVMVVVRKNERVFCRDEISLLCHFDLLHFVCTNSTGHTDLVSM